MPTTGFHVSSFGLLAGSCRNLDRSTFSAPFDIDGWLPAQYLKCGILYNPANCGEVGRFFQEDIAFSSTCSPFTDGPTICIRYLNHIVDEK